MAFITDCWTEYFVAYQNILIPATWIMARNSKFPAVVITAWHNGIAPYVATSWNGFNPPCFFIALETPCGRSNHHRMIFLFQMLMITSTFWFRSVAENSGNYCGYDKNTNDRQRSNYAICAPQFASPDKQNGYHDQRKTGYNSCFNMAGVIPHVSSIIVIIQGSTTSSTGV